MTSWKQSLKQILTHRQHRLYEREVAKKDLTYDSWIRIQEEALQIDDSIYFQESRCLKNDCDVEIFGSTQGINEGNHAKGSELCQLLHFTDESGHNKRKWKGILISNDIFCRNMDNIIENFHGDILLLRVYEGKVNPIAYKMILREFISNENIILIYGDEDVQQEAVREEPWFKPDWSPDRFLSCFYFGALVAVRMDALKASYKECRKKGLLADQEGTRQNKEKLYLLLFEMLKMHHAFEKGHSQGEKKVSHIPQVLYHAEKNGYHQIKDLKLPEEAVETWEKGLRLEEGEEPAGEKTLLSIIIPSKDNPRVLFHCLDSLLERTRTEYSYEIIVVDNGSREENRKPIEERLKEYGRGPGMESQKAGFTDIRYLYQPMPFNFSKMCNLGAAGARGGLLLFLNDDMEILQPRWLDKMAEKALLPYAGAVGGKLLYPDSEVIQHAGITNLRVGPAHKLQFLDDEKVHYFGMNRGVHNMLAVTGACLMVRRSVFEDTGGFPEELAVAFNDVDLCYTIYEQGYYNIVRNDVVFYHHESLSRGKDGESEEKQLRLLKEKDILYERHQGLYGKDPFYHPYLSTDMLESEYRPAYHYQVTLDIPWAKVKESTLLVKKAREDLCLVIGMECAMDIYKWQYGVTPEKGSVRVKDEDMGYYFQGYSFVIGSDNACYKKKLLLKKRDNGQIFSLPVAYRYRPDIRKNLKDQLNVDLTGFVAKMRREELPPGVYQFGMLAEDQCSRQKLVNWSNWVLQVAGGKG